MINVCNKCGTKFASDVTHTCPSEPRVKTHFADDETIAYIAELESQLAAALKVIEDSWKQDPVAFRYKSTKGHWRYVGAPLTKGWDFPTELNHAPLYAAPVMPKGE